jgi:hypothetical protein
MNKQDILHLLNTNDRAIARALVVLNERQTTDEQISEATFNCNGRGFTPADAHMGTSMANYFTKWGRLSEKQVAYWKKPNAKGTPRINKYATQLLEIANEKANLAMAQMERDAESRMHKLAYDAEMEEEHRVAEYKMQRDRQYN